MKYIDCEHAEMNENENITKKKKKKKLNICKLLKKNILIVCCWKYVEFTEKSKLNRSKFWSDILIVVIEKMQVAIPEFSDGGDRKIIYLCIT